MTFKSVQGRLLIEMLIRYIVLKLRAKR